MSQPPNQPWDPNAGNPGYPPQQPPGYPPAGPPPGYPNSDDKTYALVAHFGGAVGSFITLGALSFLGPLIALLARGNESPVVKEHARNALNFFIPVTGVAALLFIARVCAGTVVFSYGTWALFSALLWLVQVAVGIVGIAFGIIAGIKANEGGVFKYPISLPIIK